MAEHSTRSLDPREAREPTAVRVEVVNGTAAGRTARVEVGAKIRIGTRDDCALQIDDDTVSRQHLEIQCEAAGVVLVDLGSKNGSWFAGSQFTRLVVQPPAAVRVGGVELRITVAAGAALPRFGALVGTSAAMRAAFDLMARVAPSELPVLIRGETGTGKELAARAIHDASDRAARPYAVVDLAAIAPSMIESELFGHVRGAFTGAAADRAGAFEDAKAGTVFLDEIGELDLAAQPRLLRVLETGEIKRLGSNTYRKSGARIIAATNRDLAAEITAGRFRADLFHRIAGIAIELPPLRDRPDDIPVLIAHFAAQFPAALPRPVVPPETLAAMQRYEWPGNVRQLRKVLERATLLAAGGAITAELLGLEVRAPIAATPARAAGEPLLPFKEAKQRLVDVWEREYLEQIIAASTGNVTRAAQVAGIARVHLHRLLKKHGLES